MKIVTFNILVLLTNLPLFAVEQAKLEPLKTSAPISKYIYGQFIEHLGRCIYGGIWAEMLEDRKFYYPITDSFKPWGVDEDAYWKSGQFKYLKGSPWQVIGRSGTVTMDSINAYVGKHTPVIHVPGDGTTAGISQDGLSVQEGKRYLGRIVLAGDASVAPVQVRLLLDNKKLLTQSISNITNEFQTHSILFKVPNSSDLVRIEIVSKARGSFRVGTLSLMPADNLKGWRPEVVALLKELDAPIYRWPGGNFVSGYNWRDGIGERDKRPPRKNPAWKGVEHNDVGIHEYMELMSLINAEPFVSVNTGLGTVEEVAEEVEYCNGSVQTAMGKLRSQNGHAEPYGVKWWAVGNEMYGSWQLGHMPLAEYVKKHNRVAEAMWKVDPQAKLVAVGAIGEWSKTMLSVCPDYMNLLSEHIYCQEKPDLQEHVGQLAKNIRNVAQAHREYRKTIKEIAAKDIRIAMDEWNYWYGPYVFGELGVRYHHKDGLGVAKGLHEYFRNSDIYFMANYAQTVNVIGCIKTTQTEAAFETTGLVLKLYRRHFGVIPFEILSSSQELDLAAAWTEDKKAVTISVVNTSAQSQQLNLDCTKMVLPQACSKWTISHTDPEIYNEPGKKPQVSIVEGKGVLQANTLTVQPLSITLFRFDMP
jgi:alpha-L-arabinofuranosidase